MAQIIDGEIASERGRAAGLAAKREDWSFVSEESRWIRKAIALAPEDERRDLRFYYDNAYRVAAHRPLYID